MLQLILHLVGDYVLQSHWQAVNKARNTLACLAHCATYTLPFLILTRNAWALLLIFATHFLIDRFRLARYVNWVKNWQSPNGFAPWKDCQITGYFDATACSCPNVELLSAPTWLRVWLCIITDNTLHLICNYVILRFVAGLPM